MYYNDDFYKPYQESKRRSAPASQFSGLQTASPRSFKTYDSNSGSSTMIGGRSSPLKAIYLYNDF